MMLYVDAFAGDLKGVKSKIEYLKECGVNYLHLMPLLKSPKDRSDGGYAVSDFLSVQPQLGTMADLQALTSECHKNGISCCLDFVMNHTSEDHEWAKAARNGDEEARKGTFSSITGIFRLSLKKQCRRCSRPRLRATLLILRTVVKLS